MFRSHNVRHISLYPYVLCCQWVLYSSYVPRPKTIIASLAIWDQMSKEIGDPLRADEKFMIQIFSLSYRHFVPTHPSHSWFWSGSHRIDAKSALRHICCLKFCLDFLWRLMDFIQVVGSPSCIFHVIVPDEIRKNLLNTCRCRSKIPSLWGWDSNQRMWSSAL